MSVEDKPFEVSNNEGENTRIHYVMTSGDRKLQEADCVIEGKILPEDITTIQEYLNENGGFEPRHVGLPDLVERMPLDWEPGQGDSHTIIKLSYTDAPPTPGTSTAHQFVCGFEAEDLSAAYAV